MNNLYIGIKGTVVCLDKLSGNEIWSTKLKGMSITNIFCEDKKIFAYTSGHLFCLDADFGKIQWKNTLSGYGYGSCIFAVANSSQQQSYVVTQAQKEKDAQASQAAT